MSIPLSNRSRQRMYKRRKRSRGLSRRRSQNRFKTKANKQTKQRNKAKERCLRSDRSNKIWDWMSFLTSECKNCPNGRHHSGNGGKIAEQWLIKTFKKLNFRVSTYPIFHNGKWLGTDNIIAKQKKSSRLAPLVVMAHYDHLGPGFPGADDNASGVACMLAVVLHANQQKTRRPIWALATTGEEDGLLGSKDIVERMVVPRDSIIVNLDMVGRRDNCLTCDGRSPAMKNLENILLSKDIGIKKSDIYSEPRWAGRADYSAFLDLEEYYPTVINFTVEDHDRYHTSSDILTDEYIDTIRINSLAKLIVRIANLDL